MKELSLNILDIAENSVKANAKNIRITIEETANTLTLTFEDDGHGMSREVLQNVTDPFCTSRTTRKVGLGVPFLKLAAEQTGGTFSIESRSEAEFPDSHGTVTKAVFNKNSIDFTPLGDVASSVVTLIRGAPDRNWFFSHTFGENAVELDTQEIRRVIGDDVPLDSYEIMKWIEDSLNEEYSQFEKQ